MRVPMLQAYLYFKYLLTDSLTEKIVDTDPAANRRMRTQAAIEYLTTYGWALLIIAIAAILLYIYVLAPSASAPNTCMFNTGEAYCRDAIFSSNSVGSTVVLIISNQQQYPVASPVFLINVQGTGNVTGTCSPGYVLSGGALL